MDTPPNSTAVMKVFDDGALPTGRRLKGPPTAMARDHPEDLGLEKQALNEDGSSTSRPPYELTGRKEGLASSVAHRMAQPTCGNKERQDSRQEVEKSDYDYVKGLRPDVRSFDAQRKWHTKDDVSKKSALQSHGMTSATLDRDVERDEEYESESQDSATYPWDYEFEARRKEQDVARNTSSVGQRASGVASDHYG